MGYKECIDMELCGDAKKDFGFLVNILDWYGIAMRKIKLNAGIGGKCPYSFLRRLANDNEIMSEKAFAVAGLLNAKAYSAETRIYAKEREKELQEIRAAATNEINKMLENYTWNISDTWE